MDPPIKTLGCARLIAPPVSSASPVAFFTPTRIRSPHNSRGQCSQGVDPPIKTLGCARLIAPPVSSTPPRASSPPSRFLTPPNTGAWISLRLGSSCYAASGYEPVGREFESLRARHFSLPQGRNP